MTMSEMPLSMSQKIYWTYFCTSFDFLLTARVPFFASLHNIPQSHVRIVHIGDAACGSSWCCCGPQTHFLRIYLSLEFRQFGPSALFFVSFLHSMDVPCALSFYAGMLCTLQLCQINILVIDKTPVMTQMFSSELRSPLT